MKLAFATGNYGEFSFEGGLPWGKPIKEDMLHFQEFCAGKVLIMGYKTWLSMPESTKSKYKMLVLFSRKDKTYEEFDGLKFFVKDESQFVSFIEFLRQCEEGLDHKTEHCVIGGTSYVEACLKNLDLFDTVLYTRVCPELDQVMQCNTAIDDKLIDNLDLSFRKQAPFFYEKDDMVVNVTIFCEE